MIAFGIIAAVSIGSVEPPGHGHAFVVHSTLSSSILVTSGDSIGCKVEPCTTTVYITFPDRTDARYRADVLEASDIGSAESIVTLKIPRGELKPLPIAEHVDVGEIVTTGKCGVRKPYSVQYIASVAPDFSRVRHTIESDATDSGCPVVSSAGVVGLIEESQIAGELSISPGPFALTALVEETKATLLNGGALNDPVEAEKNLLSNNYNPSAQMLPDANEAAAVRVCSRANEGNAQAEFGCGVAFLRGVGAPSDLDRALLYLRKAAARGVPAAGALLKQWQRDAPERKASFGAAYVRAFAGDATAMKSIADDYRLGYGVPEDLGRYEYWNMRANAGEPRMSKAVPIASSLGQARYLASKQSYDEASHAYLDASENATSAVAIEAATYILNHYNTLNSDQPERLSQLMRAAGNAHYWLADDWMVGYFLGFQGGNAQAEDQMRQWQAREIEDAAAPALAHDPDAEAFLARLWSGTWVAGVSDCDKALFWTQQVVAEKAHSYRFGIGLESYAVFGSGGDVSPCLSQPAAIDFLKTFVRNGDASAAYMLGMLYDKGKYVQQNRDIAIFYYRIAAKGGVALAKERLSELQVTP